jgi:hypothetical protein
MTLARSPVFAIFAIVMISLMRMCGLGPCPGCSYGCDARGATWLDP